jgi:hypothetical protein
MEQRVETQLLMPARTPALPGPKLCGQLFAAAMDYIENNPVKAGLVTAKEKWPWSSAWKHSY